MKSNSLNRLFFLPMRGSLIVSAALMATSACVYAQTSPEPGTHQVTRAEVRHELEELESVGYNPSQGGDSNYPADIQAAEQRLEAKHQAQRSALMSGNQAAQTGENQTAQTRPTP
ncbi:DUF4148 domain-containing protein [Cupriavidus sp. 2MCAB6]|uniref:DUF4148 domain-containing protein n=1 Tax=Cupriavidus sp. 2MCAB6 TaxID=3232981 RepID=UPI003F904485